MKAISLMKFPRTLGELETYLGFTSWLRKYVAYYAQQEQALQERKILLLLHGPKSGPARKMFSTKTKVSGPHTNGT